jgi:hypothetical protein
MPCPARAEIGVRASPVKAARHDRDNPKGATHRDFLGVMKETRATNHL